MNFKKYEIVFAFLIMIMIPVIILNQQILAQGITYKPYYDRILEYCYEHIADLQAGKNPVDGLLAVKLIPTHFQGMTCKQISDEAIENPTFVTPSQ